MEIDVWFWSSPSSTSIIHVKSDGSGVTELMYKLTKTSLVAYEPRCEKTGFLHICENKDADQLRGDREADQRLCFRYTDNTIPLLPKSEISGL